MQSGYDVAMDDPSDAPRRPAVPPPPGLPEVRVAPAEEVLDGVPSRQELADGAQPAGEIVSDQPSVDDILRPERG